MRAPSARSSARRVSRGNALTSPHRRRQRRGNGVIGRSRGRGTGRRSSPRGDGAHSGGVQPPRPAGGPLVQKPPGGTDHLRQMRQHPRLLGAPPGPGLDRVPTCTPERSHAWRVHATGSNPDGRPFGARPRRTPAEGVREVSAGVVPLTRGRAGHPGRHRRDCPFLASAAARQITGQVIAVDCGERTTR